MCSCISRGRQHWAFVFGLLETGVMFPTCLSFMCLMEWWDICKMSPVLGESFRLSFAGSMIVLKIPFLGISVWGTSVKSLIYNIFTGDIGENCRQGYWRGSYNCKHMLPLAWYMTKFCMEHNFTGGISGFFFFFFSSQTFTNPACCSPGQCLAHQLPSKEGSLVCCWHWAADTSDQDVSSLVSKAVVSFPICCTE